VLTDRFWNSVTVAGVTTT